MSDFKPFGNLTIIDLKNPTWRLELLKALPPRVQPDLHLSILAGQEHTLPLLQIIEILENAHECNTIVLEKEYFDIDFQSEVESFYCRTFVPHQKECFRLHFFTTASSAIKEKLFDLEELQSDYRGYMILRNIEAYFTGRTVVSPHAQSSDREFYLCKADFPVNLSGSRLIARGTPFIQQDANVGACAQACLWMTSVYMHQKFHEFPRFTPAEISDAATRFLVIDDPGIGLAREQVTEALRALGFRPRLFLGPGDWEKALLIYSYVESEIPVILLIKCPGEKIHHAILAIGHEYDTEAKWPKTDTLLPLFGDDDFLSSAGGGDLFQVRHNIEFVPAFYVQDDILGPYRKLPVFRTPNMGHNDYTVAYDKERKHVSHIIVPHPPEVNLSARDAFVHSRALLHNLNRILEVKSPKMLFKKGELPEKLFLRSYLTRTTRFKRDLKHKAEMPYKLREIYRSIPLPKYVWVTEISSESYLRQQEAKSRKRIGEIVLDSSANSHAFLDSFLIVHLCGRVIIRGQPPNERNFQFAALEEKHYPHHVRQFLH